MSGEGSGDPGVLPHFGYLEFSLGDLPPPLYHIPLRGATRVCPEPTLACQMGKLRLEGFQRGLAPVLLGSAAHVRAGRAGRAGCWGLLGPRGSRAVLGGTLRGGPSGFLLPFRLLGSGASWVRSFPPSPARHPAASSPYGPISCGGLGEWSRKSRDGGPVSAVGACVWGGAPRPSPPRALQSHTLLYLPRCPWLALPAAPPTPMPVPRPAGVPGDGICCLSQITLPGISNRPCAPPPGPLPPAGTPPAAASSVPPAEDAGPGEQGLAACEQGTRSSVHSG